MSSERQAIVDSVGALADQAGVPRGAAMHAEIWSALRESGFADLALPEAVGGAGGDVGDVCALVRALAARGVSVPITEHTLVAGWLLGEAGSALPAGTVTCATGHPRDDVRLDDTGSGWRVRGALHRVPWATEADHLVVLVAMGDSTHVVMLARRDYEVSAGANVAGETRDGVTVANARPELVLPASPGATIEALRLRGALGRAAAIAGALERVDGLTTEFTSARQQFGRSLARFQAIQRHLALIAERTRQCSVAVTTAAENAVPDPDPYDVACAKIVAGEAATAVAASAHQAHGAIGMTREYELGHLTRRVWSWRGEFGSETHWRRVLGRGVATAGVDALWPRISTDRVPAGLPADG